MLHSLCSYDTEYSLGSFSQGYIGAISVVSGDPYRIVFGSDSWGNTCNRDNSQIENSSLPAEDLTGKEWVYRNDISCARVGCGWLPQAQEISNGS